MKKTARAISHFPSTTDEPKTSLVKITSDLDILEALESLADLIDQPSTVSKAKKTRKKKKKTAPELEKLQEIEKEWDKELDILDDILPLTSDINSNGKKENVVSFSERKLLTEPQKKPPGDSEKFGERFFEASKHLRLEDIQTQIDNADSPEELFTLHKIALHIRDLVKERIKTVSQIEPKGEITFGESRKPKETGDGHYLVIGMQWKDKNDKRHHQSLNLERILSHQSPPAKHSQHQKETSKPSTRKR